MATPSIKLYVDVVSPFAYIGYHLLRHDPVFSECKITFVPVFLGGIMIATSNTAPMKIKSIYFYQVVGAADQFPDKNVWIEQERRRWTTRFNIPIKREIPPNFPPLTLYIMRALAALTIIDSDQETVCKAFDKFFEEIWVNHTDVQKPEAMMRILTESVGMEKAKEALAMSPNEGKVLLLQQTEKALSEGAFGLPWFVCTDRKGKEERFWGVDHLGQVAEFLEIEKPMNGGWKAVL